MRSWCRRRNERFSSDVPFGDELELNGPLLSLFSLRPAGEEELIGRDAIVVPWPSAGDCPGAVRSASRYPTWPVSQPNGGRRPSYVQPIHRDESRANGNRPVGDAEVVQRFDLRHTVTVAAGGAVCVGVYAGASPRCRCGGSGGCVEAGTAAVRVRPGGVKNAYQRDGPVRR